MSVKLNRLPKPEESQKDSNFKGKTILYPGFEPGTSGLAVGSHNHCTIWVGRRHSLVQSYVHKYGNVVSKYRKLTFIGHGASEVNKLYKIGDKTVP
jgi:hypothetical protein